MKKSMKKIISFALMLSLLVGMMAGFNVFAAEEEATVEIVSKNVYYADNLKLMYGVKATGDYDTMVVKVYDSENKEIETIEDHFKDEEKGFEVFISKNGVPAQSIYTEFYAVAELYKGETRVAESAKLRYSVLEYLYERLTVTENVSEAKKAMYKNLLAYADSLAAVLIEDGKSVDRISEYAYVRVADEDGNLVGAIDGYSAGMYKVGTEISASSLTHNITVDENTQDLAWQITEKNIATGETSKGSVILDDEFEGYTVSADFDYVVITPIAQEKGAKVMVWKLLTNINDLKDGDQIVIVAGGNYAKAIGVTQNDNNRASVGITKISDGTISAPNSDVQIITVEKSGDVYYLCVGDNQYLYAASTSKNYMRTKAKADDCQWNITISDGVATIKSVSNTSRGWMRYNSQSDLFSTYSSGQNDICIYVYSEK